MSKYCNYRNYIYDLSTDRYSVRQMEIYFKLINNFPKLRSLSGSQMAVVALLMASQKEFGFNECFNEFNSK